MPYLYLTIIIALADQALKLLIQNSMYVMQCIEVWPGVLTITYAQNTGAAFSILQSQTPLLIIITLGVFVVVWMNRHQTMVYPRIFQIGLAMALGGALGNLIDRIRLGYVIDYMDMHFWPVFNLADAGILCGVGLIILGMLRHDLKQKETSSTPPEFPEMEVSKEEKI